MLTFLIIVALSGLIIGALARLALPGPDPMSIWMTMGIGVLGSLIGGLIASAIAGRNAGSFLLSFAVSVLLVYLVRRSRGQTVWNTRRDPRQTRF